MDGLNPPATGTPGANARVASRCIFKQFFKSILRRAWSESRPIPFVESTDVVSTAGTKRKVDEITEGEDLATTEAQPADDAMKVY
jgi:hypothetical protein